MDQPHILPETVNSKATMRYSNRKYWFGKIRFECLILLEPIQNEILLLMILLILTLFAYPARLVRLTCKSLPNSIWCPDLACRFFSFTFSLSAYNSIDRDPFPQDLQSGLFSIPWSHSSLQDTCSSANKGLVKKIQFSFLETSWARES